ncbi:hypothetical protein GKZ68_21545 (plasmid) [Hymenobacter sp. BRD128]|uniref:hypothetical protein n=1 Tax=Hymenobacter sp. BRD128 TaxID=2675878 RepID=UPI001564B878|nr:hypothetical protein [Hymenobacter sp. BRD128]QKG59267.1 hypothetical protein GKZ68_21545 [Hymenobacter sp. BRD128]
MRRQQLIGRVVETFYLAGPQGLVLSLRHPKRDLRAFFPAHARQLEAFAQQQHLRFTSARDLCLLLTQLNAWLP